MGPNDPMAELQQPTDGPSPGGRHLDRCQARNHRHSAPTVAALHAAGRQSCVHDRRETTKALCGPGSRVRSIELRGSIQDLLRADGARTSPGCSIMSRWRQRAPAGSVPLRRCPSRRSPPRSMVGAFSSWPPIRTSTAGTHRRRLSPGSPVVRTRQQQRRWLDPVPMRNARASDRASPRLIVRGSGTRMRRRY